VSEDEIEIICFLLTREWMERREEKKTKEKKRKKETKNETKRNETKRTKETKAESPCKKLKLGVTTIFFVVVVCYFLSVTLFFFSSPKHNVSIVHFLFFFPFPCSFHLCSSQLQEKEK